MVLKGTFTAAFGLITAAYAIPIANDAQTTSEKALGNLFAQGVASYYDSIPKGKIEELERIIEGSNSAQACEDVYLIFARGTFEPAMSANLGMMVGMPFSAALSAALGKNFGSIGVDYNNGVVGYLTGGKMILVENTIT